MKKNFLILFAAAAAGSLLAQPPGSTPPPVETPGPAPAIATPSPAATNAPAKPAKKKPAKKSEKKAAPKKKDEASELRTVPLVAGPASVEANNVNVRGQPKLKSEVVTRLTKGQQVTVIEEITHNNSAPDEPSAWAKIVLPPGAHVWINTAFITNDAVKPKKLNLRSGPGENYSIIGRLQRGDPVKPINTKEEWTEIESPTNAYAFVAAQFLKQEPAAPTPPAPPLTQTTVTEPTPIATATTETSPATPTPAPAEPAVTNAPTASAVTPAAPSGDEPLPKRIVQREGWVRGTYSIQAPTRFELVSADTHRTIDYLYTTSPNLDLRRYKGLRIVVTGEEAMEERWGNTPVITIQKIQVLAEYGHQ